MKIQLLKKGAYALLCFTYCLAFAGLFCLAFYEMTHEPDYREYLNAKASAQTNGFDEGGGITLEMLSMHMAVQELIVEYEAEAEYEVIEIEPIDIPLAAPIDFEELDGDIPRAWWYEQHLKEIDVLNNSADKTYMCIRAITNRSSPQWDFIYNQKAVSVSDDGLIRDRDGYIAVALGSFFGDIGSRYIFILDTGIELRVVKVDRKDDRHTCRSNFSGLSSWDVLEIIVDSRHPEMRKLMRSNGYINHGNFNNDERFEGFIEKIYKVLDNN